MPTPLTPDDLIFFDLDDRLGWETSAGEMKAELPGLVSQAFAKADAGSWDALTFLNTALYFVHTLMTQRGYTAEELGLDAVKSEQLRGLKLDLTS